jgi:HK97 family phage portal protein
MGILTRVRRFAKAFNFAMAIAPKFPWSVQEPYTGAWQRGQSLDPAENLLRNSAVYASVTGIATDIGKLRIKLTRNVDGIWEEITANQPWLPVLRKPNPYQTRIKFVENWILSKLLQGNAYILKERDARGIVSRMHVLDPLRVTPLVTSDGAVYYRLGQDQLAQIDETNLVVPASEIIHDLMPPIWHPLVGVPPLYACAMAASLGNRISTSSETFFANKALPGGILTAPGHIEDDTAKRLKADFEKRYGGANIGRVMVAGDGLEFKSMQMTAENSQLAEQFELSVADIARAFHYPMFKLGGDLPPYAGNTEALITTYYTDCLQTLIECLELSLDEGLGLPTNMGTELDLDNLMRMDTNALYDTNTKAVGGGWMSPDEARFKANFRPVDGGSTPYLQQQNYSLAALAKRDASDDPFGKATTAKPEQPAPPDDGEAEPPEDEAEEADMEAIYTAALLRELET